jgi:hypothetical protein
MLVGVLLVFWHDPGLGDSNYDLALGIGMLLLVECRDPDKSSFFSNEFAGK